MRSHAKTIAAVVGITALAVVGIDTYTYAGTGDSLILGKLNKSKQTTHIKTTGKGPALSLHAKGKRPALAVDSKAKIVKLNADRVDGKNAAGLQNNVRVFTTRSSTNAATQYFELPTVRPGRYLATYNVFMLGVSGNGECYFYKQGNPDDFASHTQAVADNAVIGLSATGVIKVDSGHWQLYCHADATWSIHPSLPIQVTLTRIDKTIGGSLDAARTGPKTVGGHLDVD